MRLRYLLILFFSFSTVCSWAAAPDSVRINIREARRYATDKSSPNFAKARAAIGRSLSDEVQRHNPEVLFAAGEVEYRCFFVERNKPASGGKIDEKVIYQAATAGFGYLEEAYGACHSSTHTFHELTDKQQVLVQEHAYELFRTTQGFRATAGFYYKQKDWKQAYQHFQMALHALDCPILVSYAERNEQMRADFQKFRADSIRHRLVYSCAVTATLMKEHRLAIQELEKAKNLGIETNKVYQQLCKEYLALPDTLQYIVTLRDAMQMVPDEPWFGQNLLNCYLTQSNYDACLSIIDQVIRTNEGNAYYLELKGRLLEDAGQADSALSCFTQAVAIDSTLVASYSGIGRYYFNQTITEETRLVESRQFDRIYRTLKPHYEKVLEYYWRAYQNDVRRSDRSIADGLRTVLYRLFSDTRCKNPQQLVSQYNEVSVAYGLKPLTKNNGGAAY